VFHLRYTAQPDVWRWAVVLGDALHNLRGALDHLVYALAVQQTGQDPPDDDASLMFPICSDRAQWDRTWRRRVGSLNEPTRAAIERVQPYNRLEPEQWFMPLWWLGQLNAIDKHRMPHLTVLAAHPDEITIDAEEGTFKALWNREALSDGAALLQLVLQTPNPDLYVDLKATGAVVLQLLDYPPIGLHPTMQDIRREVVLVCRYLSQFGR